MAGRSGPLSTILKTLFALPFIGIGVVTCGAGIAQLAKGSGSGLPLLAFGAVFAGVGAWQVVLALRATRSAEELAVEASKKKGAPGPADDGEMPIVRAAGPAPGYRVAPGQGATARDVYGASLESGPLPKVDARPGQLLGWALGVEQKSLKGQLLFAVIWNLFVWPFFFGSVASGSVAVSLFVLLFVVVGVYVAFSTIRRLLARRKLGRVEIDAEPAYLGSPLAIHVEQGGPAQIIRFRVSLVCREEVRYTVGTSTRTETHEVLERLLLEDVGYRIGLGEVKSHELSTELPADAPPSFGAAHNSVAWSIRVRAEIDGWPDYDEAFGFRALPRPAS